MHKIGIYITACGQNLTRDKDVKLAADAQDTIKIRLTASEEWDGMLMYARFFHSSADNPIDVRFEGTDATIPHEFLKEGVLSVAIFGELGEKRMTTNRVRFEIVKSIDWDGLPPVEATPATESLLARMETAADAAEVAKEKAETAATNAVDAAEKANAAAKYADDAASGAAEATELANNAASYANASAQAADNAASNIMQRVEAGEFNGTPFRFSYQVGSVEELGGITGQQKFDLAIINSSVDDPDNSKFYMWTGEEWHYENDLSGGAGIQGPQGVQGVSLKNVRVVDNTKVEVTQYDPMTEQDRTYIIGDFAAPLSAGIQTYVDSKFQVVDAIPDNPVEGVIYMVRM